ncbi:hypothetical protein [Parabacteroides goldsteinii]|nr:hypothetical protein [Parabacteroides goldsteinii]
MKKLTNRSGIYEELIPYKSLGLSEREQQIKLDMLLEEIIRLRNLKK